MAHERAIGARVQDVHSPELALQAASPRLVAVQDPFAKLVEKAAGEQVVI